MPLAAALPTWIKVAALSFGGPAGQIGVMHRLVVEEKRWVGEERFLHAMSYCMLLPGPEAQQLATYLGWLLHGKRGGLVAGLLFIVPGFLSIFALSILYSQFRDTAVLQAIFFGLKPAVMAVVLEALLRIGRRTLVSPERLALAGAAFVAIFFLQVPFPVIIVAAAALGYVGSRARAADTSGTSLPPDQPGAPVGIDASAGVPLRPSTRSAVGTAVLWLAVWMIPIAILVLALGRGSVFVEEALFFSKAAVVTFGGAYAVLSYIAQQAVEVYGWLAPGEMLDGLGMAETTPGPLIQVVQFVGFLGAYRNPGDLSPIAAGALGSLVTAWVTFAPCFLFVFVGAPYAEYLRGRRRLQASLGAITAAIVGVILNLTLWFSLHTLFGTVDDVRAGPLRLLTPNLATLDLASLALAVAAAIALIRFRVGMLVTLGAAAAAGLLYKLAIPLI